MTHPVTPTDAPDADIPAPEERPDDAVDETETGAWMGDRPDVPTRTPDPEVDA